MARIILCRFPSGCQVGRPFQRESHARTLFIFLPGDRVLSSLYLMIRIPIKDRTAIGGSAGMGFPLRKTA